MAWIWVQQLGGSDQATNLSAKSAFPLHKSHEAERAAIHVFKNWVGRKLQVFEVTCKNSPHLQQPVLALNHKARKPSRADMRLRPFDDLYIMFAAVVPSQVAHGVAGVQRDCHAATWQLVPTSTSCVVNG